MPQSVEVNCLNYRSIAIAGVAFLDTPLSSNLLIIREIFATDAFVNLRLFL